jgi:hypothetical protein
MLLSMWEFRENRLRKVRTFVVDVNEITYHLLVYHETVWHSDSKERLGEVCVPRHGADRLQFCCKGLMCLCPFRLNCAHVCRTDDDHL